MLEGWSRFLTYCYIFIFDNEIHEMLIVDIVNIWLLEGEDCSIALSVARSIAKDKRFHIHVISSNKQSLLTFSRAKKSFQQLPENSSEWVAFISDKIVGLKEKRRNVLIPCDERLTRFIIQHKVELSEFCIVQDVPELELFDIARNKGALSLMLEEQGIAHPKTVRCSSLKQYHDVEKQLNYPFLYKPVHGAGGKGIFLVENRDELKALKGKAEACILQEYIKGVDFGGNVFCLNGEVLYCKVQKDDVNKDNPFEPSRNIEFIDYPEAEALLRELMRALKWSGVAHVDMRRDAKTGQLYIIEINARYWGSLLGATSIGVNFPLIAINRVLGCSYKPMELYGRYLVATDALLHYIGICRQKGGFSKSGLPFFFADPAPQLFRAFLRVVNKIKGKNKSIKT